MKKIMDNFDRMFEGPSSPRKSTRLPSIDHARSHISRGGSSTAWEEDSSSLDHRWGRNNKENPRLDNAPRPQNNLKALEIRSRSSPAIDSTPSEDATDLEEDSGVEDYAQRLRQTEDDHLSGGVDSQPPFLQPTLDPTKKQMVDRFIERFRIFCQTWATGVRRVASGPAPEPRSSAEASTSRSPSGSTFPAGTSSRKNLVPGLDGQEGGDENQDEDPENGNGGGGKPENPPLKFACPYRKRDPRKYCLSNWRRCALTAHESVSRVK
jgi:hypothetical protein